MRWKNNDIPDQAILTYIENNKRFRNKVAKLLGMLTGGKTSLTPEQRKERASQAAKARWNQNKTKKA